MYTQWDITAAKSLQSCLTLCDPIDGSPPGSTTPGILQGRTLEWVAISFSNAWEKSESEVAQSWLTLCDPMDCNPPGSSVHGIPGKSTGVGCHCLLCNEILLSHKKEWINAICIILLWMELEIIKLSEVNQTKTNITWYCLYVECKKWYKSTF